jgi:hypothetical protein
MILWKLRCYASLVSSGESEWTNRNFSRCLDDESFPILDLPVEYYAATLSSLCSEGWNWSRFTRSLGYRIYRDLKRGWRITSPNLEQSGLLKIEYASLEELCSAEDVWQGKHEVLTSATPETRERIARVLLDYMRRELAIKVTISIRCTRKLRQLSSQRLIAPGNG